MTKKISEQNKIDLACIQVGIEQAEERIKNWQLHLDSLIETKTKLQNAIKAGQT